MRTQFWLFSFAILSVSTSAAYSAVFYATDFNTFSSSINAANANPDSDTIYLAPGVYSGGALPNILASLTISLDRSNFTGAQDGSVVLDTIPTGEKGILTVPFGDSINLTVDGLTFENASISGSDGGNAAGIRDQSSGAGSLTVLNSSFLNNQDGILTGDGGAPQSQQLAITVSNSLFANNGGTDGLAGC